MKTHPHKALSRKGAFANAEGGCLAGHAAAMKPLRLITTTVAALLALAACTKRETDLEVGIRTQTLIVGNAAEPATLDPGLCNLTQGQAIILSVYEGLTWLEARTSQPVPAAAERWGMSPDGLT